MIYFSFKINQDYIAKNLCVEKEVEGSTCKGCCQLKKKLEHQQEQKKQIPPTENEKQNLTFFSEPVLNHRLYKTFRQIIKPGFTQNYSFKFSYFTFHPPQIYRLAIFV